MRRKVRSPLPQRAGVDAVRVRLPVSTRWATVRDHLVDRLPVPAARVDAMFAEGAVWSESGPLAVDAPFVRGGSVWFHRELPVEVPVPFEVSVLFQDENLVVVDKPHFLATIPRGSHVVETALVRARRLAGIEGLAAAHRLDRLTAGVVVFVARPELRGAYQELFARRLVRKEYLAVGRVSGGAPAVGTVVRSRIVKERGVHAAREVPGPVNAVTRVVSVLRRGELGLFGLAPETGRTHQLRVHMAGLGAPIVGDDLYPVVAERAPDDFSAPLQLLARAVEFDDPVTGVRRRFESRLSLSGWPGPLPG
ncbi:pseudouridine synthase [Actinokineospora sp. NPDC004072]